MSSPIRPRFTRAVLFQMIAGPFQRRGGDIGAILRRHGLPSEVLGEPDRLVEASVLYAAMDDMAAALNDPYFCANLAREAAIRGVPTLRDAAGDARSLGDFLIGAVLETDRLFDNVAYSLNVTPQAATFAIRRTGRVERPTIQADAAGVAFYVTLLRACLGPLFDPDRLVVATRSFAGVPPDILPERARVPSARVALSITFPPDWLAAPFVLDWTPTGPDLVATAVPGAASVPLALLRETIRENLATEGFDLARLGVLCATSPRRLQRIFAAEGTSFSAVLDEVRKDFTMEIVSRTPIPLSEVAVRAGFSSQAALSRCYRRWTGTSPAAARKAAEPCAAKVSDGLSPNLAR